MAQIHPTAVVDSRAQLGQGVSIGPFCLVEAGAIIGDGCQLESRSVVKSRTTLGANNQIGEGAVLGGRAQHLHVTDPGGTLVIGSGNCIRENVTIHRGWANDATTVIGDNCLLMVGAHVGHDCRVGSNCILVNGSMLGGHCHMDDRAYISGNVAVHQFCRIGRLAMVGGLAKITQDVPPFVMVEGAGGSQVVGLNKVGLRRNGYTHEQIHQLKEAYRIIYRQALRWSEVLAILKANFNTGPAAAFHEFFKSGKRGFVQERRISRKATLKIVDPATDEIESDATRRREAA
ncbi:MAG: acyl-ACP--UDP-N-acetylglucosamine O-acyltransferase [Pirellulaceae bacterium]|nr:acyl-ACP--UDP-N-acetylglucosamine O-acyltransferase [Pirellulaceae bacterium]